VIGDAPSALRYQPSDTRRGPAVARGLLDLEGEARALCTRQRQARDDAGELQIDAFQGRRQAVGQSHAGTRAGAAMAEQHQRQQQATQPGERAPGTDQQQCGRHLRRRRPQHRLLQLPADAQQPGQYRSGHAQPRVQRRAHRGPV